MHSNVNKGSKFNEKLTIYGVKFGWYSTQLRIAEAEEEFEKIAVQESLVEQARERHNELKAIELEESEKLEAEIEAKKLLSNASPELTNALNNVKTLEAKLAAQEWENKKLTALVSVLELKIRDLLKRS